MAGETISYTLAVTNPGNAAIANVVVDDPFTTNEAPVLDGTFNTGDTDQDNLLDVGETWQYTASHTVTQAELDAGTTIVNTATVTGTGATPDSDDASVAVAQNKILHIEKDASVPGGTADVAGETISYTLAVTNTGNAAIANVVVDDPFTTNEAPVLIGGFNAGDTDQDNLLDVGETWQYTASHHGDAGRARRRDSHRQHGDGDGHRGDPGQRRRLGSGGAEQDPAHREGRDGSGRHGRRGRRDDQLHAGGDQHRQRGDAGVVVDDPFTTNEAPVLNGAFNAGDTDQDNLLDVGETWQYTASHTVTQAELDAGTPIVNTATVTAPGRPRTATTPRCRWRRARSCTSRRTRRYRAARPNVAGETINYTLAVTNTGNAAIANVVVDDPFTTNEAPVLNGTFNAGDTDQDNLLDVGETWQYTASHTVTQAELDAGDGPGQHGDGDRRRGDPGQRRRLGAGGAEQVLHIVKDATVPGGTADVAGETISYTMTVTNHGQRGDRRCGGHGRQP